MPRLKVLPHDALCPQGADLEAESGQSICRTLLDAGIEIEHACELSCACTTCHVIVRGGYKSLAPATDEEEDLLDRAWGLTSVSRLSCQAQVGATDLVIEIPRYTINHAKEEH
jgi:ferredoxin, 2Fe-2S